GTTQPILAWRDLLSPGGIALKILGQLLPWGRLASPGERS
ncbi:hypothetical protein A2U01_0035344, partial [Trifolium medium]|nr:hypothetical protein [Trifolium medium]